MGRGTGISWTDETWNPLIGCSRVSEGCRNCYAERVAATRMRGNPDYDGIARVNKDGEPRWTGEARLIEKRLDQPLRWRKPRMIFVNSMSDLFHECVPFENIAAIFGVMAVAKQHQFQVLTKRPKIMPEFFDWLSDCDARYHCGGTGSAAVWYAGKRLGHRQGRMKNAPPRGGVPWPLPNVWLGVSVEDQATANERIPLLLKTPAAVRWISAEPLLGPVDLEGLRVDHGNAGGYDAISALDCDVGADDDEWFGGTTLDWVIVGGESGPDARPMHPDWVRSIRDGCARHGVPFHFKQWGRWGFAPSPRTDKAASTGIYVTHRGTVRSAADWVQGPDPCMQPNGKHVNGRELDGVVHDAYPEL